MRQPNLRQPVGTRGRGKVRMNSRKRLRAIREREAERQEAAK